MPDLRLALRALARAPFVTGVAAASLALGIGANTAIFSVFERLLVRTLPVPAPDRLVNLSTPGPKWGSTSCNDSGSCDEVFSYPMFRDLESGQRFLSGLAAHRSFRANLAYEGHTLDSEATYVSGSYFGVLGLQPELGRLLGPSDDRAVGGHFVAVLAHHYWMGQLGGDPAALGRTLLVNGQPMTIVGVAARGFEGTTFGSRPSVFVPITMRGTLSAGFDGFEDRLNYWIYLFGRLQPGASVAQAREALDALYRPILTEVEAPLQPAVGDEALERFRAKRLSVEPGSRGQSTAHRGAAAPLALLFSVTGIVLLIACINVANLLLAQATTRSREMAVRLALGAGRPRLLGQLLTESLLLGAAAAALSIVVARWTLALILRFLPPEASAGAVFAIDGPAIGFAAVVALFASLLFGLVPGLRSTRAGLLASIRGGGGQAGASHGTAWFRTAMVTAQIALSMTLLATAGLFIRSLANTTRVDLGLSPDHVVTFRLAPALNGYGPGRSHALFRRVEEELRGIPGVVDVAAARVPVLAGSSSSTSIHVEGYPDDPDVERNARYNEVGPGFVRTLGMQLLAGREFTETDDAGGPPVALVTEAFAAKFGLGRDVVGKRIGLGGPDLDVEIVGLVRDARYSDVKGGMPPVFMVPYRQDTAIGALAFYVRGRGAPSGLLRDIPMVMARVDPTLPVASLMTLPDQIRENVFLDRMIGTFSTAFAAVATLLAAIGLYGMLAYAVAQRTREIGVRMALGANAARVRRLVLRQVGVMTLIGGAIGLAAAIGIGRAARWVLFEVQGHDPLALASAAIVLVAVALGAGYLPARRASAVHPMEALRAE